MRNSSYQEILIEYGDGLNLYKKERKQLLSQYKYSIIFEGEHIEIENLEKWVKKNIGIEELEYIYYNKTDYNYCFVELFFPLEEDVLKIQNVIPKIFSTYPKAYLSPRICRTNGHEEFIEYNSNMQDVIIL